jgi:hypothetical protein
MAKTAVMTCIRWMKSHTFTVKDVTDPMPMHITNYHQISRSLQIVLVLHKRERGRGNVRDGNSHEIPMMQAFNILLFHPIVNFFDARMWWSRLD